MRTRDQELYYKAWVKPVLMVNPQPQPIWPPVTSRDKEKTACASDRVGTRTEGISERYTGALEGGIKESRLYECTPRESLDEEIAVLTFLAEKKCRRLYLKETIRPATQPVLQPTTPPGGIIFDVRYCSVW